VPIRVITGKAKGRKLKMVPGDTTRPVMDRVKEALFNILGIGIVKASFLDLFAGTGSVGIEALSRGAARVVFIEKDRRAVRTIHENLEITRLAAQAEVVRADVFAYVQNAREGFEYVYVAPPQYQGMWKQTLLDLDSNPAIVVPDGVVVVQIDPDEREAVELRTFKLFDERVYGNTALLFFERIADESETDVDEESQAS
jgi:16S rRNA (guanine(966)-N(2))-methyltransferase RsmD